MSDSQTRLARNSGSRTPYSCAHPWPIDCGVQCGGSGIVLTTGSLREMLEEPLVGLVKLSEAVAVDKGPGHYTTAFFEAFPADPSCFLRGEGPTVQEAEQKCWEWYQRVLLCEGAHDYDRRDRRDGYGFCRICGVGSMFAEPLDRCAICHNPTADAYDIDRVAYCAAHEGLIPEDKVPPSVKRFREMITRLKAEDG